MTGCGPIEDVQGASEPSTTDLRALPLGASGFGGQHACEAVNDMTNAVRIPKIRVHVRPGLMARARSLALVGYRHCTININFNVEPVRGSLRGGRCACKVEALVLCLGDADCRHRCTTSCEQNERFHRMGFILTEDLPGNSPGMFTCPAVSHRRAQSARLVPYGGGTLQRMGRRKAVSDWSRLRTAAC